MKTRPRDKGAIIPPESGGTAAERVTALPEGEHRHLAILRTAMDGFWLLDAQGCVLEVNEAYCSMTGYRETELLGMHVSELDAGESPATAAAHMERIRERGDDRFEARHRRKDGSTFAVEISAQYQ